MKGSVDLRFYAFIQYLSMLIIPFYLFSVLLILILRKPFLQSIRRNTSSIRKVFTIASLWNSAHISIILRTISNDPRISVVHINLYMALLQAYEHHAQANPFRLHRAVRTS